MNKLFIFSIIAILVIAIAGGGFAYYLKYHPKAVVSDIGLDSDHDGWSDKDELAAGTDPNDPNSHPTDSNRNGLSDAFENRIYTKLSFIWKTNHPGGINLTTEKTLINETNPAIVINATDDYDHDGLNNTQEEFYGTDPFNPDTDGDKLSDGDEVNKYGTDPTNKDTDGDGMPDNVDPIPNSNTQKPREKYMLSDVNPENASQTMGTNCLALSNDAQKDSCWAIVAKQQGNDRFCNNIADSSLRQSCFDYFS